MTIGRPSSFASGTTRQPPGAEASITTSAAIQKSLASMDPRGVHPAAGLREVDALWPETLGVVDVQARVVVGVRRSPVARASVDVRAVHSHAVVALDAARTR